MVMIDLLLDCGSLFTIHYSLFGRKRCAPTHFSLNINPHKGLKHFLCRPACQRFNGFSFTFIY